MALNVSEELLKHIVEGVVREMAAKEAQPLPPFEKIVDPSGIILIKSATVKCEPFQGEEGVLVRDVVTPEEAPNIGAGIMELDHTSFEWTLSYDEYDVVFDGVLEIEADGRVLTAKPGDIVYIPKGSHIHFQTPSTARYAYFVYPSNWQEI
ncbi:MAG: cupin domain-containing protein [Synergistaceae bacterium]|nr:cupin domain-containing protein [Synergistaceae bacterium]